MTTVKGKRLVRRRDLLAGLGSATLILSPFVRKMRAQAAGVQSPGNFFFFFTSNGFVRSDFGSRGQGDAFTLLPSLSPLEPIKDQITVLRGLSNKSAHERGQFHFNISRLLTCVSGDSPFIGYGPSLDYVIAGLTPNPPLNLITYWPRVPNMFTVLTWRGKGLRLPHINDSREAYKLVFGGLAPSGSNAEVEDALAREKSLLDFVKADITAFKSRLPASAKADADNMFETIRNLETKLTKPMMNAAACNAQVLGKARTTVPPPDASAGTYDKAAFEQHNTLQMDFAVATMACGMRNAVTFMNQGGGGGLNPLKGVGKADDHHEVSHGETSPGVAPLVEWKAIDKYYAERFRLLLEKLKTAGILDDTVVVWGSEIAEAHSQNNQTFVVAGGAKRGIAHRRTFEFPFAGNEMGGPAAGRDARNASLADLWVSVQKACGVNSDVFGQDSQGGISGLWKPV
ncbi:MAG: DUF1552 domain-containing protein [Deltaproteobacteria bacterium]|nr:DUF1552 domain-containing protein [Deltaproteobacteria bacterium]